MLKPVGSARSFMYGVYARYKKQAWGIGHHYFDQVCWFLKLLPTKLAKFLVLILKPLATNEFTAKDCFHFAEEIDDQQPDFFMNNSDVDALLTPRGHHLNLHK